MDRLLYVSMSGADQAMYAQAVSANNLANASTIGFKQELQQIASKQLYGDSYESRIFALAEQPGVDFTSGALIPTERDLDVAVKGDGWFSVQATDGTEAYSREGSFRMNTEGLLVNSSNLPVLGNGGPILLPPSKKVDIGNDGTISIIPMNSSSDSPVVVDRLKLVKPAHDQLEKSPDGLFRLKDNSIADADGSIKITNGFLEASNVNAVQSMVDMMSLARQFEMQLKMMTTAQQMDEASTSIVEL